MLENKPICYYALVNYTKIESILLGKKYHPIKANRRTIYNAHAKYTK